jgi:hypothetical protein
MPSPTWKSLAENSGHKVCSVDRHLVLTTVPIPSCPAILVLMGVLPSILCTSEWVGSGEFDPLVVVNIWFALTRRLCILF